MQPIEDVLGTVFSFIVFLLEVLGLVITIGTVGSWYAVDQLTQTTAACMAQEGGYASTCAALVNTWETGNHTTVQVATDNGSGGAPVSYGDTVTVRITRSVEWGAFSLPVSSTGTAISTYLQQSGPAVTYVGASPL